MSSSLLRDNIRALKNWRVWLHLGLADIRNRFRATIPYPSRTNGFTTGHAITLAIIR